jgi:hypothetical protein
MLLRCEAVAALHVHSSPCNQVRFRFFSTGLVAGEQGMGLTRCMWQVCRAHAAVAWLQGGTHQRPVAWPESPSLSWDVATISTCNTHPRIKPVMQCPAAPTSMGEVLPCSWLQLQDHTAICYACLYVHTLSRTVKHAARSVFHYPPVLS